jgi:hypothetical protein
MDPGKLLGRIPLENGLVIAFYGQSRPVAGDRCIVQLLIDIPIPLDETMLDELPGSEDCVQAFMSHFGPEVRFQLTKTRHFVPKQDVDSVLSELQQEFSSAGLAYLKHPAFGRRYVRKTYEEWTEKERCRVDHTKAVKAAEREHS